MGVTIFKSFENERRKKEVYFFVNIFLQHYCVFSFFLINKGKFDLIYFEGSLKKAVFYSQKSFDLTPISIHVCNKKYCLILTRFLSSYEIKQPLYPGLDNIVTLITVISSSFQRYCG